MKHETILFHQLPCCSNCLDSYFLIPLLFQESVAGTSVKFCEDYSNAHLLALSDEDGIIYIFNTRVTGPKSLVTSMCVKFSILRPNILID